MGRRHRLRHGGHQRHRAGHRAARAAHRRQQSALWPHRAALHAGAGAVRRRHRLRRCQRSRRSRSGAREEARGCSSSRRCRTRWCASSISPPWRNWPTITACLLVVDNTFATPILTRPIELGADFVMESLTKMIAGHSDVTLGLVCGNDADMLPRDQHRRQHLGPGVEPVRLLAGERGLATLDLRMQAASRQRRGSWPIGWPSSRA